MRKMGIDQSLTSSGIVILENDNVIFYTTIKTKKTDGDLFKRCLIISNEINDIIKEHKVDYIAIEGLPFNMRSNVTRDLAGLQAVIITNIYKDFLKQTKIISPTALKKAATGSGKTKKEDMVEALPLDFKSSIFSSGYKKSTGLYDLADAYFLAKSL